MTAASQSPPRGVTIGIAVAALALVALFGAIAFVVIRQQTTPCPLCDAVDTGDPAAVKAALDGRTAIDNRAWQIAILAVANAPGSQPSMEIARLLVEAGADPNAWWSMPMPARRSAVSGRGGQLRASVVLAMTADTPVLVDALIARGLDVSGPPGGEALVAAAGIAHLAVVERLLSAGVPPNYQSHDDGLMPLAAAIQTRHLGVIAAIESAGGREW
jgi:hypothetical protein